MILTDRFVVLHFPKTGSTFVRKAVRELCRPRTRLQALQDRMPWRVPRWQEAICPIDRTLTAVQSGRSNQHGRFGQIPPYHRHLPVASIRRHPLDYAVSTYEYAGWKDRPPADPAEIRARFPGWPDLSFGDYLDFDQEFEVRDVLKGLPLRADVGALTLHFLRFFHPDPDPLLASLTDEAIDDGSVAAGLPPVRFLRTEHLAADLRGFLHEVGYRPGETAFIQDRERENASPSRKGKRWQDYFTPETETRLRHRERLLFRLFPDLED